MGTRGIVRSLQGDSRLSRFVVKRQLWIESCTAPEWVAQGQNTFKQGSHASDTSAYGDRETKYPVGFKVRQRDHYFWTELISEHTRCGQGRQALQAYGDMLEAGVKPNSYTFVAALKACKSLKDVENAKRIHCEVVKSGYEFDLYVGTALVDVYVKCGNLVDAGCVFEKMPHRDVVSWNAMILGCAQMDEGEQGLKLYSRMQMEGVVPNERTFVAALKACKSLLAWKDGNQSEVIVLRKKCLERVQAIHTDLRNQEFESDAFVGTMLVDVYAKCGSLADARRLFDKMPHRNVVAWTAMILGYAQKGQGKEALQLYTQMQLASVVPDERTFVGVLKAWDSLTADERCKDVLVQEQCLEQVRAVHSHLLKCGTDKGVFMGSMLVNVYAKWGCLVEARRVFEEMPHRNVVSWTAMIFGYAQLDKGKLALELYAQMKQEGVVPNERTLVGALKACTNLAAQEQETNADLVPVKTGCLEQVHAIRSDAVTWGLESNLYVGSMLVDAYAKCGSLEDARQFFEKMPHRNVVSWTAMILGYAQMDEGEVALGLYSEMQKGGVVPDERTFVAVLKACSSVAGLEKGMETHVRIMRNGLKAHDLFVGNSLIDMYSKCGSMNSAQQVFNAMARRDVVTWNALIAGYARQGESDSVFHVFQTMRQDGILPDGITFLNVLTVCSHVGLVNEGEKYFEAMSRDYGITPTVHHYTCMIDLLGRVGRVHKALAMAVAMPFQADGVVWQTVLGACRKCGNVELARQAFECAVKLAKWDGAVYTVMWHIYEAAHLWEDAKEIEALRMKIGAWRKPGQSWWTDICGTVHKFDVGDMEYPEGEQICANLEDMSLKTKEQDRSSPRVLPEAVDAGSLDSCSEEVIRTQNRVRGKQSAGILGLFNSSCNRIRGPAATHDLHRLQLVFLFRTTGHLAKTHERYLVCNTFRGPHDAMGTLFGLCTEGVPRCLL